MTIPKIFWDSFGFSDKYSGIARYARNLHQGLSQCSVQPTMLVRSENQEGFFLSNAQRVPTESSVVEHALAKTKLYWPHKAFATASKLNSDEKVIFHGLSNINLPFLLKKRKGFKYILTIHDLIPMLDDGGVSLTYKAQFSWMLPRALNYSDKIICVSTWTKDILLERFPDYARKVTVIPHGFHKPNDRADEDVREKELNQKKHLLFVSRWEKYKNFDLIVDIIEKLPEDYLMTIVTNQVGKNFLQKNVKNSDCISIRTEVDESHLQSLYRCADLYLHTSKYEGFGLPVWEALSYGTPAIFLQGHALDMLLKSEVATGLEKNCTPNDWMDVITYQIELKKSLEYQNNLKDFLSNLPTWEDSARQLLQIYNSTDE